MTQLSSRSLSSPKRIMKFKASLMSKIEYVLFFILGLLFLVGFIYNVTIRKPFSLFGTLFSIIGAIFLITISLMKTAWKYRFELFEDNTIKERYKNKEKIIEFKEIKGIRRISISTTRGLSALQIYGTDVADKPINFIPTLPVSIPEVLLKFKYTFPNIIIDYAFAQDVGIWHHKKLFGKINKERLFLLIFLTATLIGLPLLLIIYHFVKSIFK